MRSARPELNGLIRQVRTATLWAFAFSGAATLLALALPLAIAHAVDVADRKAGLDSLLYVLPFALLALGAAAALQAARQRLLTRASLWLDHSLGQRLLSDGLSAGLPPNRLDADRNAVGTFRTFLSGPNVIALSNAPFALIPLSFVAFIDWRLGFIAATAVIVQAVIGVGLARKLLRGANKRAVTQADAQGAWRTAAASSVAIAARGMTDGVVHDWQVLNGRAVASGYAAATRTDTAVQVSQATAILAVAGLLFAAASLVLADALSLAACAAAGVSIALLFNTTAAAGAAVPALVAATHAAKRLTAPAQALLTDRPAAIAPASTSAIHARTPSDHGLARPPRSATMGQVS